VLKNCSSDFVLKGRGFKPRRKCQKINPALAAEGHPQPAMPHFFRKPAQPHPFKTKLELHSFRKAV
jgi:hypothetical protein